MTDEQLDNYITKAHEWLCVLREISVYRDFDSLLTWIKKEIFETESLLSLLGRIKKNRKQEENIGEGNTL